jgi:hypothetical protein
MSVARHAHNTLVYSSGRQMILDAGETNAQWPGCKD